MSITDKVGTWKNMTLHYHTHTFFRSRPKVGNSLNSISASRQGALDAVRPSVPQTPQPVCKYPIDHSKWIIYRFPQCSKSVNPHGIMGQREIHCIQANPPSDLLTASAEGER